MCIWCYEQQLQSLTFLMATDEQGLVRNFNIFSPSSNHQRPTKPHTTFLQITNIIVW